MSTARDCRHSCSSARQRFEILVSQYEPQLRQAFLEAIDDIRSNIVLRRVVGRLERGDIIGAVERVITSRRPTPVTGTMVAYVAFTAR
jgi:hypothetical protein